MINELHLGFVAYTKPERGKKKKLGYFLWLTCFPWFISKLQLDFEDILHESLHATEFLSLKDYCV